MAVITKSVHVINATSASKKELSYYRLHSSSSVETANYDLLELKNGTFTRASEASFVDSRLDWSFQGSSESTNWKANNEPRIFVDGTILIEGSRTNLMRYSEQWDVVAGIWTNASTNASASAESDIAADGGEDADLIYFQDATANPQWRQSLSAASFTNTGTSSFSTYLQTTSSAPDDVRLFSRGKDAATLEHSSASMSDEWQRYIHVFPNVSGSFPVVVGVRSSDPGAIRTFRGWGAQLEANVTFASSYIRAEASAATRASERISFTDSQYDKSTIDSGAWEIDIWPEFTNAELATFVANPAIISRGPAGDLNLLQFERGSQRVSIWIDGVNRVYSATWARNAKLTIGINWRDETITLAGFLTGNGTFTLNTSSDWSGAGDGILYIGDYSTSNGPFYGVIGRPRKM